MWEEGKGEEERIGGGTSCECDFVRDVRWRLMRGMQL